MRQDTGVLQNPQRKNRTCVKLVVSAIGDLVLNVLRCVQEVITALQELGQQIQDLQFSQFLARQDSFALKEVPILHLARVENLEMDLEIHSKSVQGFAKEGFIARRPHLA